MTAQAASLGEGGRLRVLHCPWNVAGLPLQLARAERCLGLESTSIAWSGDVFGFQADEVVLAKNEKLRVAEVRRWQLLKRAIRDFDVIHFNFGQTILEPVVQPDILAGFRRSLFDGVWQIYCRAIWMNDLPLLRALGKTIAMTYQGDDARQSDYCKKNFAISIAQQVDERHYPPGSDRRKRQAISKVSKYADLIYAVNPDLMHVLPPSATFLPYAQIDIEEWVPSNAQNKIPIVLHAPTNRAAKGTDFVVAAVRQLKREGIALEFVLVENLTREQARLQYARADILIDQLNAGWYGGLAVELMALQKPVIAYIREDDLKFIPAEMKTDLPIIRAEPSTIYEVLKRTLTDERAFLPEKGRRSRMFVEKWHDPRKVAAKLADDYLAAKLRRRNQ